MRRESDEARYRPRKNLDIADGFEAADWPDATDPERFAQMLSARSFDWGRKGGDKPPLKDRLGRLVPEYVNARIAQLRQETDECLLELDEATAGSQLEAEQAARQAADHDLKRDEHVEAAEGLEDELHRVRADLAALPPAKRGGRFEGHESAVAASSTGILDGALFTLLIQALGGPIELRIVIALGLTAAYTVIVAAAGRLLGELWRRAGTRSARVSATSLVVILAALLALSGEAIISSGEFRAEAITNLSRGLPASPEFLIWIQAALTLAATCAIGVYHLSAEGRHLRATEERVKTELADHRRGAEEEQVLASRCRDAVIEVMKERERAAAARPFMERRVDHQIKEERARGRMLIELALSSFDEGRQLYDNEQAAKRVPRRTVDDELQEAIRRMGDGSGRLHARSN